jgi:hypothetical protein
MNKVFKFALLVSCLFGFIAIDGHAQQNHFVYIQSDDKLPFDVTVNGATYNSSSIGYVIIPKLAKGNYQVNISFPHKKYPDQQFNCSIDKADAGFLLKNYTDKGWGLYNLQTLEIIMNGAEAQTAVAEQVKPADTAAFGNMLSEVVNDSTLNVITEPVKPPVKEKPVIVTDAASVLKEEAKVIKDTAAEAKTGNALDKSGINIPAVAETANVPADAVKPGLQKISAFTTSAGTDMVFIDKTSSLNDTIRIFLPSAQDAMQKENEKPDTAKQPLAEDVKVDTTAVLKGEIPVKKVEPDIAAAAPEDVKNPFFTKEEKKADSIKSTEEPASLPVNKETEKIKEQTSAVPGPECKNMLSDNDMDKLRKKMVSADNDDKMIGVVRKNMQDKCVSTDQVKSLGALFLSDDGRYNFFNSVQGYVYDTAAFSSLESQLIDPAYKRRFRDLLK